MSTASQNYIIPEINSNKYINNNVYVYSDTSKKLNLTPLNKFHYYNNNSEILYNLDAPRCRKISLVNIFFLEACQRNNL